MDSYFDTNTLTNNRSFGWNHPLDHLPTIARIGGHIVYGLSSILYFYSLSDKVVYAYGKERRIIFFDKIVIRKSLIIYLDIGSLFIDMIVVIFFRQIAVR